jgi:hypothetical protein
MIRIAIGFFILFGAVGFEDMMIEMNQPQPLTPFLLKVCIGSSLMIWGLLSINKRGIDNV